MANFNFNKVMLGGRLTGDPELKQTTSKVPVTTFSVAVNRYVKSGEAPKADFFNVTAWRATAEFICTHFRKGSSIFLVGELQNRSWTDAQGVKHFATDVVASEIKFVDSRADGAAQATDAQEYVPQAYAATATAADFENVQGDEDLPF